MRSVMLPSCGLSCTSQVCHSIHSLDPRKQARPGCKAQVIGGQAPTLKNVIFVARAKDAGIEPARTTPMHQLAMAQENAASVSPHLNARTTTYRGNHDVKATM